MSAENLKRALEQHVALDAFLTGDFGLKGDLPMPAAFEQAEPELVDKAGKLEEIAEQIRQCCKCGLNETRKNAVIGEGNPDAELVFVGEAPGADEDEQGRPFVGRSGKLLTKIIAAMGLSRDDVFICNILKCRPPENRDPKPDEIVDCMGYLQQQLDIIRPQVIVALGAHAARTLLSTNQGIGKLRGRFHEYTFSDEEPPVKLMPTYHPSYLLRNYSQDNRRRVWEDMQKVMQELGLELPGK
ncbi:uracil-DNA glycosylase, family 4 [Anaerohalosphaera lusitana]|uniref:Type-4 uracil-DNA glycosylase n=1 Tax=Anaerohalosphaera lusitana TaxID=1936003 RepID=A0A1U9NL88_9BACT|nr:uracil-DNA glycosylase [Anaerohalosphaera lusitana]AQT68567.1 uracil-DNA glycosylase, family 4 [Anaerohalosphaera lusitana]